MRIGLVSLITKTADLPTAAVPPLMAKNLRPETDCDINVVELSRRIAARGNQVTVLAADAFKPRRPCPPEPGLEVDYLGTSMRFIFPAAIFPFTPSLASKVREGRMDAILTAELFQSGTLLTWFAARGLAGKVFVWQELDVLMRGPAGRAQSAYYRTLGRKAVSEMAGIVTRSLSARAHLLAHGVPEEKIAPEVVHSGVDCELFRPTDRERARARFGLEGHEDVVLCVGRAHPNKGLDVMIRAMPRLLQHRPDAALVIKAGGPQLPELRELVRSLGLEGSVRLMPEPIPRQDMPLLFGSADLLAITSRIDLFPFTAIEAISCGVPVATSFGRGLRTDIVDRGAGVMLPSSQ
ncbi:MAG: glycosyltransferase family 4 protein, partial [Methanomassiliicoccales archaeon]|nr:glycosyltransferase family 4 protein [Methanomassiliicoccales archaeon]